MESSQEREIRQLQEASVTSDGMLSCYTPFLLAIAKSRVADARERSRSRVATVDRSQNGIVERVRDEERDASTAPGSPTTLESYPVALCLEALWALSEYAVLSPGLATAEVLPLAEELAGDALENPLVLFRGYFVFLFFSRAIIPRAGGGPTIRRARLKVLTGFFLGSSQYMAHNTKWKIEVESLTRLHVLQVNNGLRWVA